MKKNAYIIIFLIIACLAVFGRIAGNDFINFDDPAFITENSHIQSGFNLKNVKWALTTAVVGNWHPLTLFSHMLDWKLFGANAGSHHLVSLLLHIGAVIFLFLFLNKTTNQIWLSAFAAAFFALHPLRVESVAWAAERKDVLSMFFGMASIYVYAFYAEGTKPTKYFLCLIFFALSLMSKPMLVTLPFVLLLLDYWPLKRLQTSPSLSEIELKKAGKLILEKVPFFILTILSSIAAIWAQNKENAIIPLERMHFYERLSNAIVSYASYLGKIVWPVSLAIFYPYENSLSPWKILLFSITLFLITAIVIYNIKKLPFLSVGWLTYLGTLIPVIGLLQVGEQAMADRYTYLPSIGVAIILAWGIPLSFPNEDYRKKILFPLAIAFLFLLALLSYKQCGYWKNSVAIFSHTLQAAKDSSLAHNNLGMALFDIGKTEDAIYHYNKAILCKPSDANIYSNRGNAYIKLRMHQLATEDYNEAIRLKPDSAAAYINRGNAYNELGLYQQAIEDYNKSILLKPDYVEVTYNNRGTIYKKLGQLKKAIDDFSEAIRLNESYATAYNNRGIVYSELGQQESAIENFSKVISLRSNDADAHVKRALSYEKLGQYQLAVRDYNEVIRLKPTNPLIFFNRGTAYIKLGQYQPAIQDFNAAIRLKPDYADAYNNRAFVYLNLGQYRQAYDDYSKAISIKPDYADAFNNRAFIDLSMGNMKTGCTDAKKACKLGTCSTLQLAKEKGLCR